jgi:hypothetical protein
MRRSCSSVRALVVALCAVVLLFTTNPAIQAQSAATSTGFSGNLRRGLAVLGDQSSNGRADPPSSDVFMLKML